MVGVWGLVKDLGLESEVNIQGVKMMETQWMVVSQKLQCEYLKYKRLINYGLRIDSKYKYNFIMP